MTTDLGEIEEVRACSVLLRDYIEKLDIPANIAVNALFFLYVAYSKAMAKDFYMVQDLTSKALQHYKKELWEKGNQ